LKSLVGGKEVLLEKDKSDTGTFIKTPKGKYYLIGSRE
jgi:hypothetical protein